MANIQITGRAKRDWMRLIKMPTLLAWLVWIACSCSMTVRGARVCWMRWPLMCTLKFVNCEGKPLVNCTFHNKLCNFIVNSTTISANVVETDFVRRKFYPKRHLGAVKVLTLMQTDFRTCMCMCHAFYLLPPLNVAFLLCPQKPVTLMACGFRLQAAAVQRACDRHFVNNGVN